MKNFSTILLLSIIINLTNLNTACSQNSNYHNKDIGGEFAMGLRFGGASGLSIKKYAINNYYAFEAVASFGIFTDETMRVNVLFEK